MSAMGDVARHRAADFDVRKTVERIEARVLGAPRMTTPAITGSRHCDPTAQRAEPLPQGAILVGWGSSSWPCTSGGCSSSCLAAATTYGAVW